MSAPVELPLGLDRPPGDAHPYVVVDVFTDTALAGNQLGVFTDGRSMSAGLMQRLARELDFAETVFLLRPRSRGDVRIRIFTPTRELDFAGHPVLGAGVAVAAARSGDTVRIETAAGAIELAIRRTRARAVVAHMAHPVPTWRPYEHEAELLRALGVHGSALPVDCYENGPLHAFVALGSADELTALTPDFGALAALPGLAATCFTRAHDEWTTRTFAPAHGVNEDAATGSAAGPLAIHLARHAAIPFGQPITIRQGAQIARPSTLHARADGGPARIERVEVGGAAVVVAHGQFYVG